jgi:protein-disulfide isomerase
MSQLRPPLGPRDRVQGNPDAPIRLAEYGDYECPYCGRAYRVVKALQDALGDHLLFAWRDFPLSQVHPHALRAAAAADAADLQGRFWEMHDMLFEHQDALDDAHLLAYAKLLGLDLERFARDLDSDDVAQRVRQDFLSGARSGVNGTPTFFVNGQRYDGSWEPDDFLESLRDLLAEPASPESP